MNKELFNAVVAENELCIKDKNRNRLHLMELRDALVRLELIQAFPQLCGRVRLGISIGPGWVPIMGQACNRLMDEVINPNPGLILNFVQIKEKFGGLRAYTEAISINPQTGEPYELDKYNLPTLIHEHKQLMSKVSEIIYEAEDIAAETCEVCGERGEHRISIRGYHHTSCEKHKVEQ